MNLKKKISIVLILALALSVFTPISVFAAYQTEIQGFSYNGFDIPAYDGDMYEVINQNIPALTDADNTIEPFERYSELDDLGRCGVAYVNACKETMPTEERGSIGMIKPSGWMQAKYPFVDGQYLYNRCHLIGHQISGENAEPRLLITGTRAFNVEGMLPFENMIAEYIRTTNHHVLYRVTPVFQGNNLVATGVIMEAKSVEDDNLQFCVFCYNVQPGVAIDYADGSSCLTSDLNKAVTMKDCEITLSDAEYTYDGSSKEPQVTVQYDQNLLTAGIDYSVTYENNTAAGTGLVHVNGLGSYSGEATRSFKIKAADIGSMTVAKVSDKAYTGKQIKPVVTVKNGSVKLTKGTDYVVTYGKNTATGKGVLTIKGKGNYTGSRQVKFNIVPKKPAISLSSKTKTSIKIKWTNVKAETGYQVAYRKKGASKYTTKLVTETSRTYSKLKQGTEYQFKVRAYKKANGTKIYGNWSKVITVKTKGTASVKPSSGGASGGTVYITESGTKYHLSKSCRGLSNANKVYTTTKSKAKAKGLTLCGYEK